MCAEKNGDFNLDFDEYKTTVIQSLREKWLMNIYVQNGRIRLQGGFDRTHQLLLANASLTSDIMKKLEMSKLHVLETMNYEDYFKLT